MELWPQSWQWLTNAQKDELTKMYGYLATLGLVGKKLALQTGADDVRQISLQLTEHLCIEPDEFHQRAVAFWIQQAVEQDPLQKRLRTVKYSLQMLDDVTHQPCSGLLSQSCSQLPVGIPPKGTGTVHSWYSRQLAALDSVQDRAKSELENLRFWTDGLIHIFKQLQAPIFKEIENCMDKDRALSSIAGRTRANTLRNYVKTWNRFHRWLWQYKQKPVIDQPADIVDYLHSRADEPCGPSVPLSIVVAVRWILRQAGMQENWANNRLVSNSLDFVRESLSGDAKLVRRAPRYCAAMLESMERYVVDADNPSYLRVVCWVKLLKIWGSLRYDCHTHMKPQDILLASNGLSTTLRRTKTTGGPRRVAELPVHVSTNAYLYKSGWLHKGFKLLQQLAPFERDYLLPCGSRDLQSTLKQMARYEDAAGAGAAVLRDLENFDGSQKLIHHDLAPFWTEHSERNLLPSTLVFLDVEKSKRDMVGRWRPEGSDTYMRTYNGVVAKLQLQCAVALSQSTRYEDLDEDSVVNEAEAWLVRCKGLSHDAAAEIAAQTRHNFNKFPLNVRTMVDPPSITGFPDPIPDELSSEEEGDGSTPGQASVPGFVVVFEGAKARLHKSAGCWHVRLRKLNRTQWFETLPESSSYHAICKLCWPNQVVETDSASDTASSGNDDPEYSNIVIDD